jgi:hypothetical protein
MRRFADGRSPTLRLGLSVLAARGRSAHTATIRAARRAHEENGFREAVSLKEEDSQK